MFLNQVIGAGLLEKGGLSTQSGLCASQLIKVRLDRSVLFCISAVKHTHKHTWLLITYQKGWSENSLNNYLDNNAFTHTYYWVDIKAMCTIIKPNLFQLVQNPTLYWSKGPFISKVTISHQHTATILPHPDFQVPAYIQTRKRWELWELHSHDTTCVSQVKWKDEVNGGCGLSQSWKLANRQIHRSQTLDEQGSFNKLTQFNSQLLMGSTQSQISLSNTDDRLHTAVNYH